MLYSVGLSVFFFVFLFLFIYVCLSSFSPPFNLPNSNYYVDKSGKTNKSAKTNKRPKAFVWVLISGVRTPEATANACIQIHSAVPAIYTRNTS